MKYQHDTEEAAIARNNNRTLEGVDAPISSGVVWDLQNAFGFNMPRGAPALDIPRPDGGATAPAHKTNAAAAQLREWGAANGVPPRMVSSLSGKPGDSKSGGICV